MKKLLSGFLMALTMYTVIPVRHIKWDDEYRPYMITCLPIIGVIIGAIWSALFLLLQFLVTGEFLPRPLAAAIFALYPFLISGGLHLDGFMDVNDALKSCRDLDERRRILKDSHVGAFATVAAIMLFLIWYAACLSLDFVNGDFHIFFFIPIISRSLGGLAVALLPSMSTSEYTDDFRERCSKGMIAFIELSIAAAIVGCIFLCDLNAITLAAALLGFGYALFKAYKGLEGMNGDIAGYSIVVSETVAIIAFAEITFLR